MGALLMPHMLFGHRGARGEAPENTLTGFTYARRAGVTAFELDVHLSADGEAVVIHDPTVDRTTGASGPVAGCTADRLWQLDACATWPAWPEREGVPRLAGVLARHRDLMAYQIEIKTHAAAELERLCPLIAGEIARAGIGDRAVVTSFDPRALEIMAQVAPEQPRGLIGPYDGPRWIEEAIRLGCSVACAHLRESGPGIVREARAAGLRVTGWLGNTVEDLKTLVDWGVDDITTDYPGLAIPFLRERGWLPGESAS